MHAPRFVDVIGDHQLYLAVRDVVHKAELHGNKVFVLGPGRGSTATHPVSEAASARNRTVVHYRISYRDGKKLHGATEVGIAHAADMLINAQHGLRERHARAQAPPLLSTDSLIKPITSSLRSLIMQWNVTGFFDTPWVSLFTELFFAFCPRGVRVVFSTRDALAWAKSRQATHSGPHSGRLLQEEDLSSQNTPERRQLSRTGFVCPFAPDPRLLDPFSLVQCAAFARSVAAPASQNNESRPSDAQRLPGSAAAAHDFESVGTVSLAAAMHKYNQYVQRVVPENLLLQVNFFNGLLLEGMRDAQNSSSHAFSELEQKLIATFASSPSASQ